MGAGHDPAAHTGGQSHSTAQPELERGQTLQIQCGADGTRLVSAKYIFIYDSGKNDRYQPFNTSPHEETVTKGGGKMKIEEVTRAIQKLNTQIIELMHQSKFDEYGEFCPDEYGTDNEKTITSEDGYTYRVADLTPDEWQLSWGVRSYPMRNSILWILQTIIPFKGR